MSEHLNREKRSADWANDGVHRIPCRIDPWNFVGKKFQEIKGACDRDDDGVAEDFEGMIGRRENDPMLIKGEADGEDGEVKIDAGEARQAERDTEEIESLHAKIMRRIG